MNEQIKRPSTSTQSDVPPKRGRGRPRRDDTIPKNQQVSQFSADPNHSIDNNMVGKVVYGVIEGSFDSGYLISVKNEENNILMRGVVFHPQMINPLNRENDVAPNAKLVERKEAPIPVFGSQIEDNNNNNKSLISGNGLEEKLKYEVGAKSSEDMTLPLISSADFEGKVVEDVVKNVPIVKGFEVEVEKITRKDNVMQENEVLGYEEMTKKDEVMQENDGFGDEKMTKKDVMQENEDLGYGKMTYKKDDVMRENEVLVDVKTTKKDDVMLENEDLVDVKMTEEDESMQENEGTTTLVNKPRNDDKELVNEEQVEIRFDNGNEKQMMQVNELEPGKSVTESEPETKETTRDLAPLIQ